MLLGLKFYEPIRITSAVGSDTTARLQTVDEANKLRVNRLERAFGERTEVQVGLNTSFDVQSERIIEPPDDAIQCSPGADIGLPMRENRKLNDLR